MAFTDNWNVIAGEIPTANKWNQLGDNDDYLKSRPIVVSDNSGAFDLSAGQIFVRTLNGSNNTLSLTNVTVGKVFIVEIIQDATGPTWWSGISWAGGAVPFKSASGKRDIFGFRCISSGAYYGVGVGENI